MKKILPLFIMCISLKVIAFENRPTKKFISINKNIFSKIESQLDNVVSVSRNKKAVILEMTDKASEKLSSLIHQKTHRCGGFMSHGTLAEAENKINVPVVPQVIPLANYEVNQQALITPMIEMINEVNIRNTVKELSDFGTRYYKSKKGTESAKYVLQTWKNLIKSRNDASVELFNHADFPQPSVILTIKGSDRPDEIIILGGHLDSISWDVEDAPGADDNASGIATITEVLRVMMLNNFKPKRTIQIIGYAAEEVGLLGSQEIANSYAAKKANVLGVLQLDMTLFKGTIDKDIVLISDYTHNEQNKFLGKLIDEYVHVPWGYSECGYGCSDHASWSALGYPASFSFESNMNDHSSYIHSPGDNLENYNNDVLQAVNFSKLAAAFLIEMGN